jgi:hypothetical protein
MAYADGNFMDLQDHVLQQRLRNLLHSRARYRRDGAKNLSRDIDCAEKTAKNILAGHWPRANHLRRIVMLFGVDAWSMLFAPDVAEVEAALAEEIRHLESQLEEKRRLARQVAGVSPIAAPVRPDVENRAAAGLNRPPPST